MKAKTSKAADTRKTLQLAKTLRTLGNIHEDDQQALYGLLAMLGGLELLRHAADATRSWGDMADGLVDELAPHFDKVESILKKYRAGILCDEPERATA
jgi:hypothetical protein